jgi:Sulfatase
MEEIVCPKFLKLMNRFITALFSACLLFPLVATVQAQEITGTPGSPEATTTITGKQLPAPDPKFGGVIKEKASESTPWWPPRIVPPKGAPNVLLIMTDDQGFGAPSTFGGVIPTPNMDRIAKAGLRYTNFHSTSLCSPTRAAIITGRNHHSEGYGVVGEIRPWAGFLFRLEHSCISCGEVPSTKEKSPCPRSIARIQAPLNEARLVATLKTWPHRSMPSVPISKT